jgi:hypothetical protein
MTKQDAIKLFGGMQKNLADALKKTEGAISQWPDELNDNQVNIVIGAAVRRRIAVPDEFLVM